jgi:hypothetical protein
VKKKIAILQSNYIPWIGYFDIINSVDEFVIYDSVQYTKNDWRNRNLIKTANGPIWLTIPIATSRLGNQSIREAKISGPLWTRKHWKSIEMSFVKSPYFEVFRDEWLSWYEKAGALDRLHDVNVLFLRGICKQIGIHSKILLDSDISYSGLTPSEKLISICKSLRADTYITGPAGLNYLDKDSFADKEIRIDVMDYGCYEAYRQGHGAFTSNVSILDLLANVGVQAKSHLLGRTISI